MEIVIHVQPAGIVTVALRRHTRTQTVHRPA